MAHRSNNFIERSIVGVLSFLKESLFADAYALKNGFLQSLDPRIKMGTIVLFILATVLLKRPLLIFSLYLFCLFLTCLSKINLMFFLKRTWVFIPLFSLFIALPALFQFFSPGEPLWGFSVLGIKVMITRQGLVGAILFVSRVLTAVSFVVLLSLTTRHTQILRVLRVFGIPQIFVMIVGMCYRYIYLFIEILQNTYLGIKSRVGIKLHYKKGQEVVASSVAVLWQRSYQLNNEVYNAMLSRGYTGEPKVFEEPKINLKDWMWLFFVIVVSVLLFYLTHA